MLRVKKSVVATAAVVATLAVAGCGSAGSISGGQSASLTRSNFASTVSKATSQVTSVHVAGTFTSQGQSITMTGDEAFGDQTLKGISATMAISMPSVGKLEARVVGGVIYLNTADLGLGQAAGKPWVKVDLTDTSNPLGAAFSKITSSFGPGQLVDTLKAMSTLKKVGSETVDGVAATHYQVSVDTTKLGTALGVDPSELGGATLPKVLQYDVWLDSDNRPVKVAMVDSSITVQLHFSHWGEPVHVVAPPASEVSDVSL